MATPFTPGTTVKVIDHPLERAACGLTGTFLGYSQRGYARVAFEPRPEWTDQSAVIWLMHPEALECAK